MIVADDYLRIAWFDRNVHPMLAVMGGKRKGQKDRKSLSRRKSMSNQVSKPTHYKHDDDEDPLNKTLNFPSTPSNKRAGACHYI